MALNIYVYICRLGLLSKLLGQVWSISDNWIFSLKCDIIYTNFSKAHQGRGCRKKYKSRRVLMSAVKHCLSPMTWLFHSWMHSSYGYLYETCIRSGQSTFQHGQERVHFQLRSYAWLMAAGGGWFFFRAMAVGRLPTVWWMAPCPCACVWY